MTNEIRGMEEIRRRAERVIGTVPTINRSPSGLYSFDRAVGFRGELGTPSRGIIELYGDEHTGKSTLAYYLVGGRAGEKRIVVCDLEASINKEYIENATHVAGHTGEIFLIDDLAKSRGEVKSRPHEDMIGEAVNSLLEDNVSGVIVDSYGAFTSIVARGKPIGERSVGQEAKTLNDVAKRANTWIRETDEPKWYFIINHTSPNIGGKAAGGFTTPGGRKTKYLAIVRAWIRRIENDWPEGSGNFVAEVAIQKLKYGAKGRKGWVYFIPGYGVSKEMTAVTDCVKLGLAKAETNIKLEVMDGDDKLYKWMSQGKISTLAEKALEPEKNKKTFQPFFDALEKYNVEHPI